MVSDGPAVGLVPDAHEEMQDLVIRPQGKGIFPPRDVDLVFAPVGFPLGNGDHFRNRPADGGKIFADLHYRTEMPLSPIHDKEIRRILPAEPS